MYVADQSDDKVYTYNMPDAIDARLATLELSGVEFGEFLPRQTEYEGVADEGVTKTTVEAVAVQSDAEVTIEPPDAAEDADGHQVAVEGSATITVTVTSPDGSRETVYRVALREAGPSASCLGGTIAVGFSLVVYEGGSIEDLDGCAKSRNVTALYALDGGAWVPYILGAPEFVNDGFGELYAGSVPPLTPLVAKSDGPATAAPVVSGVMDPQAACLRGEMVEGFSIVFYEGGSIRDFDACAVVAGATALYVLNDGAWVPYILGAPSS